VKVAPATPTEVKIPCSLFTAGDGTVIFEAAALDARPNSAAAIMVFFNMENSFSVP
jgi:hypothetical protein